MKCVLNSCISERINNSRFCHEHCDDFIMRSLEGLAFARADTKEEAYRAVTKYITRHNLGVKV